MKRSYILLIAAALLAVLVFAVRSCGEKPAGDRAGSFKPSAEAVSSIVALRDGSTLVAADGTIGRDLVNWLADPNSKPRYFELGGKQFVGESPTLANEAIARIPRLVMMLQANPEVKAVLIGHSDATGNPQQEGELAMERALAVAGALESAHIGRDRLTIRSDGARYPLVGPSEVKDGSKNDRVGILLYRDKLP